MSSSSVTAAAAAGEQTAPQQKFNPSWMRSAFHGGGGGGGAGTIGSSQRASALDDQDEVAAAMISNYSYDRDTILSLIPKGMKPPNGLKECPFFIDIVQDPVVKEPLTDLEERLQQNINSSKAMSALSQSDRLAIAAGNAFGSGYTNGAGQSPGQPNTRWTPVKSSWSKSGGSTAERPTRGRGAYVPRLGRTPQSENGFAGPNSSAPATPDDTGSSSSPFAKYGIARRGGAVGAVGRGGSTNAGNFNSRAEGLYNPNDPSDRPKPAAVARSESGDDDDEGGWSTVGQSHNNTNANGMPKVVWGRSESWSTRSNTENAWSRDANATSTTSGGTNGHSGVWDRAQMLKSALQTPHQPPTANKGKDLTEGDEPSNTASSQSKLTSGVEGSTSHDTVSQSSGVEAGGVPIASSTSEVMTQSLESAMQFTSAWQTPGNSINSNMLPVFDYERLRMAQIQHQQQQQQQLVAHLKTLPGYRPIEFYYLDPSDIKRGPFSKEQMVTWFKAGYFTDTTLRVQRGDGGEYKTIGTLLEENGKMTPFDYPEDNNPSFNPALAGLPGYQSLFGTTPMWGPSSDLSMYGFVQNTIEQTMAAERQRLQEEHNRRVKEDEERLKKIQDQLLLQMTIEKELSESKIREQEQALIRHREELQRKEREMKEHALELQRKLENEQLQLEAKKRAIEAENARRLAEEQRIEAEIMRKAEEERAKRAAEERMRRAEIAAEEERKRLEREAEDAAYKIIQMQKQKAEAEEAKRRKEIELRDRKMAEELSRKLALELEIQAKRDGSKLPTPDSEDSESWTTAAEPPKEVKHTKVAPWAASKQENREKTLREIQLEEERQMRVEQERLAKIRKDEQVQQAASQPAGNWSGPASRLQWTGSASPTTKPKIGPVWGAIQETSPGRTFISPLLSGPSLEDAKKELERKKSAPTKAVAPVKPAAATPAKPAPAKQAPKAAAVTKSAEKSPKPSAIDSLTSWFGKRFKQLQITQEVVDTNMLLSFVMDLENPNEVEDIVMSYLEESKAVKEFVREFLKRRIEMKSAGGKQDVDDLSSARNVSAAPSDGNSASSSNGQGKKKKKNQKTVLDGNILGFRGAAASDRLNKGEIDAIPTAPVNPSRR